MGPSRAPRGATTTCATFSRQLEEMSSEFEVRSRFMSKVFARSDQACWLWQGTRDRRGYGYFWLNGRKAGAHRVAWTLWRGDIPEGLVVDHLCAHPPCTNPAHLQLLTAAENARQRQPPRRRTHCQRGHRLVAANVLVDSRGRRRCRECQRRFNRAWMARRRQMRRQDAFLET